MQEKQKYIDAPLEKKKGLGLFSILLILCGFVIVVAFFVAQYSSEHIMQEPLHVTVEGVDETAPEKPFLPDISGFTVDAVEKQIPPLEKGVVLFDRIDRYPAYRKFLEGDAPRNLRLLQRRINPMALVVAAGHYDWDMLYDEVHAFDPDGKIIAKEGYVYTLRVPLLVMYGASLAIRGSEVSELRLSKQANAFLVNSGDLFVTRTKVIGWNEDKSEPSYYVEKKDYRPFLINWAGGKMNLAGSDFVSLGYLGGKSYGISYSACTPCAKIYPDRAPSTGIVVGNRFIDVYYGFYSYEAEDVAIIDNKYIDNIVYGIDPHDRSKRLIIAKNEAYGTKEKHGIIVSREVNDGWIFDNYSHHNKGSGFMIDRTSVNNVIANNIAEHNEQDGLTFFESENNITWGNILRYNKKNGVRIRNSWDIMMYNDEISGNGGTSIEVYTTDISGQKTRDFELDPYTQKASAIIDGARISTSGAAVFKIKNAELMGLRNIDVRAATHLFPVSFDYDEALIKENIGKPSRLIKVQSNSFPDDQPPAPHEKSGYH